MKKLKKNFNIIIAGVGGQGLITLTRIIAQAALIEGYDVKTSELHGLSQRGGSVQTHIRFGNKVYSPLVPFGKADLILGLEITESLRNINFANEKTIILANKNQIFYQGAPSLEKITRELKRIFKNKAHLIPASETCQKKLGKEIVSGIYLLGVGIVKKIIPLREKSILLAIKEVVPQKYFEINKKALELAKLVR